jgi:uncharacterized protein (TIGR03086 family)
MDIQELDRRAVDVGRAIVATVTVEKLGLPTPCAEWDLGALLAHMTVQHHGFARAVAGERVELADWQPRPAGADVVARYDEAADRVIESFRSPADINGHAHLAEIQGGVSVPVATAISFHFVDYVVHGWDVAAALGVPIEFDDEVLTAALTVAAQVPADEASRAPGMAFAPTVATPAGGGLLAQVLASLGRSPSWPN